MQFKYKGRNQQNKPVSGIIEGKTRKDAIAQLKKEKITVIDLIEHKEKEKRKKIKDVLTETVKKMNVGVGININISKKDNTPQNTGKVVGNINSSGLTKRDNVNNAQKEKLTLDDILAQQSEVSYANSSKKQVQNELDSIDIDKIVNSNFANNEDSNYTALKPEKKNVLKQDINMNTVKELFSKDIKLGGKGDNKKKSSLFGRKKVKKADIMLFSRKINTLLETGVPLVKCLQILIEQTSNSYFQKVLAVITKDVSNGSPLSQSMKKFPNVFDDYYTSMVGSGEATGELSTTFNLLYDDMLSKQQLKNKIISASIYPIIIMCLLVVCVIVASVVIIPQFKQLFNGVPLPKFTQVVFGTLDFIGKNIVWEAIGAFLIYVGGRIALSFIQIRYWIDLQKLRIPVIGKVINEYSVTIILKSLSLSMKNGLSVTDSLELAVRNTQNIAIKFELQKVLNSVIQGIPISVAMSESPVFPNLTVQMLKIGEESGRMQDIIEKTAVYYEWNISSFVDKASKWIEPIAIIFTAIFVVIFVFAIAIPMFDLSSGAGIQQ